MQKYKKRKILLRGKNIFYTFVPKFTKQSKFINLNN